MSIKRPSRSESSGRARGGAQLERHIQSYREYLLDRGNAVGYVRRCEAAVVHLSTWMKQTNKRLADVGEGLVTEFIERHLPGCRCPMTARYPATVRAALGHLLVEHFGDGAIRFEIITAEQVRRFFATQAKNYKTPSSLGVVVSALRGYFRWRATLGDRTHALVGALAYPANWQLASLPKSLQPAEVEQLEAAFGQSGPSMRRADAMVRCALEPGRYRMGRRHDHIAPYQRPT